MSDETGLDTQGRGILEWAFGTDTIALSAFWDRSPSSPAVCVLLTPDEARKVIAGLERCVEAVERSNHEADAWQYLRGGGGGTRWVISDR